MINACLNYVSLRRTHRARTEQYFKSWVWRIRSSQHLKVNISRLNCVLSGVYNKFLKDPKPPKSQAMHVSGFITSSLRSSFWCAAVGFGTISPTSLPPELAVASIQSPCSPRKKQGKGCDTSGLVTHNVLNLPFLLVGQNHRLASSFFFSGSNTTHHHPLYFI